MTLIRNRANQTLVKANDAQDFGHAGRAALVIRFLKVHPETRAERPDLEKYTRIVLHVECRPALHFPALSCGATSSDDRSHVGPRDRHN